MDPAGDRAPGVDFSWHLAPGYTRRMQPVPDLPRRARQVGAAGAFVLLAGLACCASEPPLFGPFVCGGFAGSSCPPGSICEAQPCDHSDCGGVCRANAPCDPAKATCAPGTVCDAKTEYCMPARTCATKTDCRTGELCYAASYSTGLCLLVPASAPETCGQGTCPFPWYCATGCKLACIGGECPATLECINGACTPWPFH